MKINGKSFQELADMSEVQASKFAEDGLNPHFIFSDTDTDILLEIVSGDLNIIDLAKDALINRGVNKEGKWVGFDRSLEIFKEDL